MLLYEVPCSRARLSGEALTEPHAVARLNNGCRFVAGDHSVTMTPPSPTFFFSSFAAPRPSVQNFLDNTLLDQIGGRVGSR